MHWGGKMRQRHKKDPGEGEEREQRGGKRETARHTQRERETRIES